jgi:lysophospholipase L1-like esterase
VRFFLAFVCLFSSSIALASIYIAIGDSITSGLNSEPWSVIQQYSWATGWGIERPFSKTLGVDSQYNVALPGATTGMIGYQVQFASHVGPEYVSIVAGANDICFGKSGNVVENIEAMVRTLAPLPNTKRIFVGAVPDIRQIYQMKRAGALCKITQVACAGYFFGNDEYRRKIDQDIIAINRSLMKLQVQYSLVKFVDISRQTYEEGDISTVDCFHPSAQGQQKIADVFAGAFHEE